ncbi:MAG: hypothetical protein COU09_01370 [Candidatus Harrisonbacteria bacterium CG10_big_fil_rev_8_21_14_0_10_44_23]|uniref:Peptidase M50 domain-containing protein n=1 Tax=Candidatus Harrisonbacteria bacterium CG10_big_fil_rev_8_21_14_0_10_44_23 TaxID=1974585 RepID=A0A2H0US48_9BACT|nr:MAG: hypothetical protein COU09_01370 [Candidatus Harrisonbacteria bacterium CG10_big_fil_rev_8_21_14_0_10_44_23]
MGILVLIVSIVLLILLHELGHFLAAKSYGMKVEEFGFGFPPKLFSKKWGETEYSFNLFPLGGFVRILGENQLTGQVSAEEKQRSFSDRPARQRLVVLAAGVAVNFLLGWLALATVLMVGAPQSILVTQVLEDSPALEAGLQTGDQIQEFSSATSLIAHLEQNAGKTVELSVLRDGQEKTISLIPSAQEGKIGSGLSEAGLTQKGFFAALKDGLVLSLQVMAQIIKVLGLLIFSIFTAQGIPEGIVGPVGVFSVASDLSQLGFIYVIQLVGIISLNLAILNAIPFPALDGGRFLFVLIEKIKGSKLSPKFEIIAHATGFALLLLLMIFITVRDVVQLF